MAEREPYIIEVIQVGNSLKVSAIEQVSGIEVSVIVPTNATRMEYEKLAIQKLESVLAKRLKDPDENEDNLY